MTDGLPPSFPSKKAFPSEKAARSEEAAPSHGVVAEGRAGLRTLAHDLLSFDRRALTILLYVPLALTVLEFVFVPAAAYKRPNPEWVSGWLRSLGRSYPSVPVALWPWLWWSAGCLVVGVFVPLLLLRLVTGDRPAATGLKVRGTLPDARVYLLLFLIFSPVVWWVSQRAEFRLTYPFYPRAPQKAGGDWIAFEVAYFLQFLSVEYFFRGFLTLGLKPALGRASVLVMLAPYCMIHFHKPFLEALGAVGAGAVLGCLSWRTGTIVYGWFLHFGVALTMDLLSLHQAGRL